MTGAPSRPYREVGLVEAQAAGLFGSNDASSLVSEMREYAGELGCDALVIFAGNDSVYGGNEIPVSTRKGYRGSCLMYEDGSTAATLPARSLAAQSCIPNSTLLCHGPGGCRGGQRCSADGHSYTPCDCGGQWAANPGTAARP